MIYTNFYTSVNHQHNILNIHRPECICFDIKRIYLPCKMSCKLNKLTYLMYYKNVNLIMFLATKKKCLSAYLTTGSFKYYCAFSQFKALLIVCAN